jgi:ATP-binding cassette subfamily B protein
VLAGAFIFVKKLRPIFKKAYALNGELSGELVDNISGIKEIKIFNRYENRSESVTKKSKLHVGALLKALLVSSVFHPSLEFVTSLGTIIVIIGGGLLAIHKGVPTADIVAFTLYLTMFYAPITNLGRLAEDIQNAVASGDRVFEVLDEKIKVAEKPNALELKDVKGDIFFSNVSFSYQQGQRVLENVSFGVSAGKTLAIVGPTGVGKSTIINLMLRFYDPLEGAVIIDNVNIKDVTLKSLRDNISVVMQDTFLFSGTIEENIAFAKDGATHEDVVEAAKKARIHDEIVKMQEGYQTQVGERGLRLSGGQKQRLSIARSIIRNAPILILDEATASVDVETEQKIQEALAEAGAGRTMITIAHRLSTIKSADKIIVLEDKHVLESGTHDELIKSGGLYSRLNFMQLTGHV